MRVALGAWGIGGFAAAHNYTWRPLFGHIHRLPTIPPMSSIHAGVVELFSISVAEKIFIDATQYQFILDQDKWSLAKHEQQYLFSHMNRKILHEFVESKIIMPVDYYELLTPFVDEINQIADQILAASTLPFVAAKSRELWRDFLLAPGGLFLPTREYEIAGLLKKTDPDFYDGPVDISIIIGGHSNIPPNISLPKAAVLCGHDVFDVVSMLMIGKILGAAVCDWQMYDPIYKLCIDAGYFAHAKESRDSTSIWYLPIPKDLTTDSVWRLRKEPLASALEKRNSSGRFGTPDEDHADLMDLRASIHKQAHGVILNPYQRHARSNYVAFAESIQTSSNSMGAAGNTLARLSHIAMNSTTRENDEKDVIFISYAHADNVSHKRTERYFDRLIEHLTPFTAMGTFRCVSDKDIVPGQIWRARLENEIENTSVAILLISSAYLASEFIRNSELPSVLRRWQTRGTPVISIILNPCLFEDSFFMYPDPKSGPQSISLAAFQAINSPSRPMTSMSQHEQDELLRDAARAVHKIMKINE
jgi:TIR domain-containing protein